MAIWKKLALVRQEQKGVAKQNGVPSYVQRYGILTAEHDDGAMKPC